MSFLMEAVSDRQRGALRPVSEYKARYAAIASEVDRLYPEIASGAEGSDCAVKRVGPYAVEAELGRGGARAWSISRVASGSSAGSR